MGSLRTLVVCLLLCSLRPAVCTAVQGACIHVVRVLLDLVWQHREYMQLMVYVPACCVVFRSQEGSQFCRGFGGVGGILRYQVNMAELEEPSDDGNSDLWSDEF